MKCVKIFCPFLNLVFLLSFDDPLHTVGTNPLSAMRSVKFSSS